MGIQDRDYYRNEGPSVFDTLMPSGLVCRWLIGINVGVWVLQMIALAYAQHEGNVRSAGWITDWFMLDTNEVLHGQVWRLVTSAFLHSTDMSGYLTGTHLLFNMICLWWFGSDVEQLYGRKEFLAFYLSAAVSGSLAYVIWQLATNERNPALGASGAVTGLLVLCALHFPGRTVLLFMFLPMPIWLFAVVSVAKDVIVLFSPVRIPIGVTAHLGGAAFAFVYWKYQRRLLDIFGGLLFWKNLRPRARLKIYRPEVEKEVPVAVAAPVSAAGMDEHLEAKLDAVLEKIATKGKESLTMQEQDVLKRAAEMYKRRRT
jgi:membrane associated rhomboid family serine protease